MRKIIDEESFYGANAIKTVVVPDGTTRIGSRAFADSALEFIIIPDSVNLIVEDAFDGCGNLIIAANTGSYAYNWAKEHGFFISPTKPSPAEEFAYTVVNNGIKITGYAGNSKEIWIPEEINDISVVSISGNAFYNNTKLEFVYIPDSVNKIESGSTLGYGDGTFYGCVNLKTVRLPKNLTDIAVNLFKNCERLVYINIPQAVTKIGENGFYGCKSLASVSLPESITRLEDRAFAQCTNLKNIQMPEKMLSIGEWAFAGCENLENIVIPYGVTALKHAAFSDCKSLYKVVIPETVTQIGESRPGNIYDDPFIGCSNLKQIVLPNNVSIATKYLSGDSKDFICPADSLTAKTLGAVNVRFKSPNAANYKLQMHASGIALGIATYSGTDPMPVIPTTIDGIIVNRIHMFAFSNNAYIRALNLPESIISIENSAFSRCEGLKEIIIPRSVTEIGDNAFEYCTATIKCYNGSYAQTWAEGKGITVSIIEE